LRLKATEETGGRRAVTGLGRPGGEQGSAALYFAIIAMTIVFAAAVVVDGGRKMSRLGEAVHLADNGARACAQAVDEQALLEADRDGVPVLNQEAARAAAARYFLLTDVTSFQVAFDDTSTRCIVTVTLDVPSMALPMGQVTSTQSAVGRTG